MITSHTMPTHFGRLKSFLEHIEKWPSHTKRHWELLLIQEPLFGLWQVGLLNHDWRDIMPGYKNREFVSCRLDKQQLKKFDAWFEEYEAEFDTVVGSVHDLGYKITITKNEDKAMFTATIIPRGEAHVNDDYMLSAWDHTHVMAVMQACYKVLVVFDGGPWSNIKDDYANRG